MSDPAVRRSAALRLVAIGCSLQVAWLALASGAQTLTLRLEETLDALGAGPALSARALDAWVLLPLGALAALFARAAWRRERRAARAAAAAPRRWIAALPALAAVALASAFLGHRDYLLHRFAPVREGVLYRSAQLGRATLEGALRRHQIRTLVSLRDRPEVIERERTLARRLGVRFVHVPMADTAGGVARFLQLIADPANRPVLAHCRHGIARTGVVSAVYRMEYDGWDNRRALREARRFGGYDTLEDGSGKRRFILSYVPGTAGEAPKPRTREAALPAPGADGG